MKSAGVVLSLAVSDPARSLSFYRAGLGLACTEPLPGIVAVELPGITLFLSGLANFTRYSREAKRTPLLPVPSAVSFLSAAIGTVAEVDGLLESAAVAGGRSYEPHEITHQNGRRQYVGTFTDPDGHLWQLVCNLD